MDYTTLERVTNAIGSASKGDDALVARLISETSRTIDRYCSGFVDSDNYFMKETVTDELTHGRVDGAGVILCHVNKPRIWSLSKASFRTSPLESWLEVRPASVTLSENYSVMLWAGALRTHSNMEVKLSYLGGLYETQEEIPGDLGNAADVLAVRFYREIKSNLTDSIGIAEMGTLTYTKSMPVRVTQMLAPYKRWIR